MRKSYYRLIAVLAGILGAVNSFTLGFYIVTTYFEVAFYDVRVAKALLYPIYVAATLIAASILLLAYGSYLIFTGKARKGGVINLIATMFLSFPYIYFTFFSEPSFLKWLSYAGIFLLAPSALSGVTGILTKTEANSSFTE